VPRLKVLFITNWYPTRAEPIKAVWVREHAKAVQLYDDVVVLHSVGADLALRTSWRMERETDESLSEGIQTCRVWYRPAPIPKTSYAVYLWSVIRAFRQIVKEGFGPDLIHVHIYDGGGPGLLIAKPRGLPLVVSEQFSSFPRRLLRPPDLIKAWLAFRWADAVLPVSHALQRAIEHYGIRARFHVIPNVVDTTLFVPGSPRRRDPDRNRILFVGQLRPVRGIPHLLQALSRLDQKRSDWQVDIVGDGEARSEYERLATDLALASRVAFHGLKSKPEVAAFMRRADFLVLSSLCETFSAPAAEALAVGTPVLATRCGGPEEFISEDVGALVAPGDADALYRGLDEMLDHLQRYSGPQIAQYARDRFSPELVGAQLHAVYESLRPRARSRG
jgi:glycosyltransferase involved in cell wall biosynthesis